MLKYIEVLRALEYVMSTPLLSHEEGVAIVRNLRNALPGQGFEGAEKATIDILRNKIAEYLSANKEESTQAPVLEREDRIFEPADVAAARPAVQAAQPRGSKKKPRKT